MNRKVCVGLGLGMLAPNMVMAESPSMMDLFFGGTLVDVLVSLTGLTVMALAPLYFILIILNYRKPSLQFSLAGKLSGVASVFMIVLMLFGGASALISMFGQIAHTPANERWMVQAHTYSQLIWGVMFGCMIAGTHLFNLSLSIILHHRKNRRAVLAEQAN